MFIFFRKNYEGFVNFSGYDKLQKDYERKMRDYHARVNHERRVYSARLNHYRHLSRVWHREKHMGWRGTSYRGTQNHTIYGDYCQHWHWQWPHRHGQWTWWKRRHRGVGHHNHCRNPDNDGVGIWCYTRNWWRRWAPCRARHAQYPHHPRMAHVPVPKKPPKPPKWAWQDEKKVIGEKECVKIDISYVKPITWNKANELAKKNNGRLPTKEELKQFGVYDGILDKWHPAHRNDGKTNEWIQIGNKPGGHPIYISHIDKFGAPSWGNNNVKHHWRAQKYIYVIRKTSNKTQSLLNPLDKGYWNNIKD